MPTERQNDQGRWVAAEPLPPPFGVRWQHAMLHRRSLGQGRIRAYVCGWRDTRAVDALSRERQTP